MFFFFFLHQIDSAQLTCELSLLSLFHYSLMKKDIRLSCKPTTLFHVLGSGCIYCSSTVQSQLGVKRSCWTSNLFKPSDLPAVASAGDGSQRKVATALCILEFRLEKNGPFTRLCSSTGNWFCNIKNSVAEFHYFSDSIPLFHLAVEKYHSLLNYFFEKSLGMPSSHPSSFTRPV